MRIDKRKENQLRPVRISPQANRYAEGSVIIEFGDTKVHCTASVENNIPKWLQGTEKGWVTAEYGMLPRSTHERIRRDKAANSGRTQEISRLIGRSLRSCVDLYKLGERQIIVDCDVLQADGGTRTASITGGAVALSLALGKLLKEGDIKENPMNFLVSAISVGLTESGPLLDLNYVEDCDAETDMNFVMTQDGKFVEIQGTAEGVAFTRDQMNSMIDLAQSGCEELFKAQEQCLSEQGLTPAHS